MNEHINQQIPDYVLNLLPKIERQTVEQHTAVCGHCQTALQAEREMGQMVRLTLQTATQPANGRLAQLMPPIPKHKQRWSLMMMMAGSASWRL
jgi:anti-sigma factor RsiW